MALDFSQLKANRKQSLSKLMEDVSKMKGAGTEKDDRFWKLTVDKAGNGSAIIRFLPEPKGEETPFVRFWDHGFKGPGGWYIEKSRTSIGEQDPVSELNAELWNSGIEAEKEIARKQKRRLHYVSNIYVVRDPAKPENEGKVFLFEYGKKIFDRITGLLTPDELDEREEGIDVFDLWGGCNFRLRAQQVDGQRNYDKSSFDQPTPIHEDESEIQRIWESTYSLQDLVTPDKFKPYAELKARLMRVLGTVARNTSIDDDIETGMNFDDEEETKPEPKQKAKAPARAKASSSDDDEDEEYFKNLANMD